MTNPTDERLAEIRERYANLDGARTVTQHPIDAIFLLRLLDAHDARIAELTADYLARHKTACDRFEEIIALQAALADARTIAAAAQWRPIDSAPRDGSDVLLNRRIGPPIIAGWFKDDWFTIEDPDRPIKRGPVTHWMPLPAAPATKEG